MELGRHGVGLLLLLVLGHRRQVARDNTRGIAYQDCACVVGHAEVINVRHEVSVLVQTRRDRGFDQCQVKCGRVAPVLLLGHRHADRGRTLLLEPLAHVLVQGLHVSLLHKHLAGHSTRERRRATRGGIVCGLGGVVHQNDAGPGMPLQVLQPAHRLAHVVVGVFFHAGHHHRQRVEDHHVDVVGLDGFAERVPARLG